MRATLIALSVLALTGCQDQFDDYQTDPLHGTWNLVSVDGLVDCTSTGGQLSVYDLEGMPITGDFNWSASCTTVDDIAEAGDIVAVEVDVSGQDYGVDIGIHTPTARSIDWDCTMSGDELTCIENDVGVIVWEFARG